MSSVSREALPGRGSRAGLGGAPRHQLTAAGASPLSRSSRPAGHLISTVLGKIPNPLTVRGDRSSETCRDVSGAQHLLLLESLVRSLVRMLPHVVLMPPAGLKPFCVCLFH